MSESNGKLEDLTLSRQTIFAWASAMGKAGVAVLRISGPNSLAALPYLGVNAIPAPRIATFARLQHPTRQESLDEALILHFPAPHSFTGETVLEIQTHGSLAVIRQLTELLSTLPDFRMAEAGEFARRAYFNGKFDLLEAEGLADLIDAETEAQQRQAIRQMQGHLGARYDALRSQILYAMAMMEAYIDFPDEEIPDDVTQEAQNSVAALAQEIATILDDKGIGEKIRSGLRVAIIGAPNVGKSSLMNALAKRDVAIVSRHAGTTRDVIEIEMEIAGFSITLIDTAGLRETYDEIEAEGIRRTYLQAKDADINCILFDATTLPHLDQTSASLIDNTSLVILSKYDLAKDLAPTIAGLRSVPLSTHTDSGLDALLSALTERVRASHFCTEHPIITQARHREALNLAHHHLLRFHRATALELATEELRLSAQNIAKITGKIAVDDVLDIVFGRFCIGK